jgi:hypothetical protein
MTLKQLSQNIQKSELKVDPNIDYFLFILVVTLNDCQNSSKVSFPNHRTKIHYVKTRMFWRFSRLYTSVTAELTSDSSPSME